MADSQEAVVGLAGTLAHIETCLRLLTNDANETWQDRVHEAFELLDEAISTTPGLAEVIGKDRAVSILTTLNQARETLEEGMPLSPGATGRGFPRPPAHAGARRSAETLRMLLTEREIQDQLLRHEAELLAVSETVGPIPTDKSADNFKLFPEGIPDDPCVVGLVVRLNAEKGKGKSEAQITREYAAENDLDRKSQDTLKRTIRRLKQEGRVKI